MPSLSTTARNAACDAVVDLLDTGSPPGKLVFRTSGDVAVATLTLSNPAFGSAATGVATASAITSDTNAAGGTFTKATLQTGAGTIHLTLTAGGGSGELNMTSAVVAAGVTVAVTSLTITMPAS